jgi:hypothetical protein
MSLQNCDDGSAGVCHGGRPDLTLGLEDYVMILIPAACLLSMAPLRLRRTWGRSRKVVSPTTLWWAKSVSAPSLSHPTFGSYNGSSMEIYLGVQTNQLNRYPPSRSSV